MLVDKEKILLIADDNPGEIKPTLVLKQESGRPLDPDYVLDLLNWNSVIHIGLALQCEIIFYLLIKTLSIKYDRKPEDKFYRWPSVTLKEFEFVMNDWIGKSRYFGYVGNDLAYWLDNLKKRGYLRIHKHDGVVFLAFSKEAVFLILQAVGLNTPIELISY